MSAGKGSRIERGENKSTPKRFLIASPTQIVIYSRLQQNLQEKHPDHGVKTGTKTCVLELAFFW